MGDQVSGEEIVAKTADYIRRSFIDNEGSHDWWHVERVWKNAVRIGREEGADPFIVQLAALLHDIADYKYHDGDDQSGSRAAREWLTHLDVAPETIDQVCRIIEEVTFKGAETQVSAPSSLESMVVQDADRLDAIGAIGIARAFAYGGSKGRHLHDPTAEPQVHASFDAYKSSQSATVNHFYEKLLLLKDRMNTLSARRIAEGRHAYMEAYLQRFFREWNGED